MAYATIEDVAVPLLRPLTEPEQAYASTLLEWAEILIKARHPDLAALDTTAVVMVEAQAVARVLRNPEGKVQESFSGEYQATRSAGGADGQVRITDEEWELLSPAKSGKAFSINTAPTSAYGAHSPICSAYFGAAYCSCGAVLTQSWPLYEDVEP